MVGKKAYEKKKKVDKLFGKKEESPLKTAESILKIGQKLGWRGSGDATNDDLAQLEWHQELPRWTSPSFVLYTQ